MRPFLSALVVAAIALCAQTTAVAQRHNAGSSPPTAPPLSRNGPQPIVPASSGMGALQFVAVNYGVPAPQALTRQLEVDDDRTRAASLSAIGAPGQYLVHGHIPYPRSIQLNFVALGNNDELDAILTVELDQHIVSAILFPQDGNWRRVATVLYATPFNDPRTTPATFLRLDRSLQQPDRYRAVITISFVNRSRACAADPAHPGCDLTRRWMQSDSTDPAHRMLLVTATGHLSTHEATGPLAASTQFQDAHLRGFSCQPLVFSDATLHYDPVSNSAPCPTTH